MRVTATEGYDGKSPDQRLIEKFSPPREHSPDAARTVAAAARVGGDGREPVGVLMGDDMADCGWCEVGAQGESVRVGE